MSNHTPKSPARLAVETAVRDSGTSGMTRRQLTTNTGLSARLVGRALNNMINKLRLQASEFVLVRRANAHGIYVLREAAANTPTVAPRPAQSVQRVPGSSPDRLNVIAALKSAAGPLTLAQLSIAAGVSLGEANAILLSLQKSGAAQSTATLAKTLWALRQNMATAPPARFCNSSQPAATLQSLPAMHCARPGADQHLSVPSRRGDKRASYRAPMMMGSMLGGGV